MAAYDYEDAGYDPRGPSAAGAAEPAYDPNFVPDSVKTFVAHLYRHIREKNVYEIHQMYEGSFQRLSERMFRDSPWPSVEAVAPYVDNDHVFCLLYREMWFRHVYARLSPTPRQRVESWDNYCSLFGVVLHGVVNMQLPNQWLWDMVDEFVYQFQSYCQYRAKLKTKTEEELQILREDDRVWNVYGVLNYLQALVEKSTIIQILEREKEDLEQFTATDGYDYEGGSNVLKMLGYYSMIGLLRVHCLLGDYHTGLKCLAPIDISQQGVYTTVIGSHIATIYHYGFASLMLRRYVEAVREFNRILVYIIKYKSLFQKSAQYDQILKKNEQMYALLALSLSLCPQTRLVEEASSSQLKDKYGEKMAKMQRFDDEAYTLFDELFSYACPKFITPSAPDLKEPLANYNQDAYRLQLKLFLYEVKQQQLLSGVRSYLKLYSTISTAKLATYLEVDEPTLRTILMTYKHKMHSVDSDGKIISNADVDFCITEVSFGWGHALAQTKSEKLFGWGYAKDGRLGQMGWELDMPTLSDGPLEESTSIMEVVDKLLAEKIDKEKNMPIIWEPSIVHELDCHKVSNVACGLDHSLILCCNGMLLSSGDNIYGQLGRRTTVSEMLPVDINSHPLSLSAGLGDSLVLCKICDLITGRCISVNWCVFVGLESELPAWTPGSRRCPNYCQRSRRRKANFCVSRACSFTRSDL